MQLLIPSIPTNSRKCSILWPDQLKEVLDSLAAQGVLSPDMVELAERWLDARDAAEAYGDSQRAAFEEGIRLLMREVELLEELGRITPEEAFERMNTLLNQQLGSLREAEQSINDQIAALKADPPADFFEKLAELEQQLRENRIEQLEVELELKNLLDDQNDALSEQDQKIISILRNRQQILEAARIEAVGGSISAEARANLDMIQAELIAELQAQGKSPEEIQAILDSLPRFQTGGPVEQGGLSILHPGEFVLRAAAVERAGTDALSRFNADPSAFSPLASPEARFFGAAMAAGQAGSVINISVGDIMVELSTPDANASAPSSRPRCKG
jgi:hypothetical protein